MYDELRILIALVPDSALKTAELIRLNGSSEEISAAWTDVFASVMIVFATWLAFANHAFYQQSFFHFEV